jgi:hypothetical protein
VKENERASISTTVRVSPEVWLMLRRLAEHRAGIVGGRPNVSAVVTDLVLRAARKEPPEGPRAA